MRIEIVRVEFEDDRYRQRWVFGVRQDFRGIYIDLTMWVNEIRNSRRHKWRAVGDYYDRHARVGDCKPLADVPLPDDVLKELGETAAQRMAAETLAAVQKLRNQP